jgi:uncharacterized protein YeaO (DUF488 family)
MEIRIKRVYEETADSDGVRILVDKLWPRGLSKEKANIQFWAKDIAPSTDLRKWYNHDPEKWEEFKELYFAELNSNPEAIRELRSYINIKSNVTFLFSSKELKLNNAFALKEYVEKYLNNIPD